MDDRLSHNLRCIEEGFAANGLQPERRFATGIQAYVNTERAVLSLSAFSSEEGSWIVLFGSHPARVPAARRAAALEVIARINYQQVVGNFDLDVTDGEMRYRIGHATDVDELTAEVVERLLGYVLYTWARFHDALLTVAYGDRAPDEVVRDVLASPAPADIAPDGADTNPAPNTAATEPVNVDAILRDLGLDGPIGSRPGDCATPDASEPETIQMERQFDVKREVVMPPFPNAYVVPETRLVAGEYPGAKDLSEARAKVRALLDAGVTRVIDLTHAGELSSYANLLAEEAAARGIAVRHQRRPIRDVDVCTAEQMRIILDEIDAALAAGETVYVHCWGGAGRTGIVVGCWLVRHGRSGADALHEVQALFETMSPAKVRRHPEGSPQTPAQRRMVLEWGAVDRTVDRSEPRRG